MALEAPSPGPAATRKRVAAIPRQMMAARFYQPGDVRYEAIPTPKPGPGELLVRIERALTCGTDVKCYRRGHPVLLKSFPSPFGHEFAGVVAALGEGVSAFAVGDRVVAANSAPCDACFYCHKGKPNLCENLDLLNGAYAEYLIIPARIVARNTLRIPDTTAFEAAAFAEPLAVSLRGVAMSQVGPGDRVAVIGLGPIGQLLARAATLQGAHVTAMGRNALKRHLAESFAQAQAVVDLRQISDPQAILKRYTPNGRGFDIVIEAVGLPETWDKALLLARRGGLVNLFAGCPAGTTLQVDARRLHYDEITVISPFHHTPEFFQKALGWIAEGTLDPTPLITSQAPLAEVVSALEAVEAGRAIKVALTP